jgi:Ca-activated chloride channel family protein
LNRFKIWQTNSTAVKNIILPLGLLTVTLPVFAQSERKDIRAGNELYRQEKYADAQSKYLEAVEKNQNTLEGAFNIGDAMYKQNKYEEAANQFNSLTSRTTDKKDLSKIYHNLGNSYLKGNKYKESIEAYKNALRNNPGDMDTKYNLAYAKQKLKEQQQQQNQDKNEDQKEQDKNEQKDQKKDQQKKDEQKQNEQQKEEKGDEKKEQQQQPKEGQLSKEDAQRLLDAINNEEKNVQDKLKKKKAKVNKMEIEKDW